MRVILCFILCLLFDGSLTVPITHEIRDKLYGHIIQGAKQQNSPIININNNQDVSQQLAATSALSGQRFGYGHHAYENHFPRSNKMRGDYGPWPTYNGEHDSSNMNTNIKAGGPTYGRQHHHGLHNTIKDDSLYMYRESPRFGEHHDTNMFGNTKIAKIDTAATALTASASSLSSTSLSASSSSSELSDSKLPIVSSSSTSSASSSKISSSGIRALSSFNGRGDSGRQ